LEKRFNTMKKLTGSKTRANKIPVWDGISETEVAKVLRTTLNWRAPGRYRTVNFWLKQLTATRTYRVPQKNVYTLYSSISLE